MTTSLTFNDLDLYTLLAGDADESKTFTTYLAYWFCLAQQVTALHGDDPAPSIVAALRTRPPFRALSGKGPARRPDLVRPLVLNAWTSEMRLHLVDLEDADRLWLANHAAPVDAYFATSRMASAWFCIRDQAVPTSHTGLLRAVSAIATGNGLLPAPWDQACTGLFPGPVYRGFPTPPGTCSNLASHADPHARAAMLLRTTRERALKKKVDEVKKKRKTARAPNGESRRQDAGLAATTVFDFAWRMRTRSSYGDPAMNYAGGLSPWRSAAYAAGIRTWTNATMAVFEALIAERASAVLMEAADHLISRDRSGLAKRLVAPRLSALGVAAA